ncbi:hypothetical protein CSB37_01965 [bacterium DOLZORAL124_38_8]|nr:MAG: hypothetical protein CSB37_01965 [bacterium DOLZORAL124_38_8]
MTIREKNLQKARDWAHRLQKLPGVKAVYLSGSLATQTDNSQSDIDFFIVSFAGTIFTARFFVNSLLLLCGQLAKPVNHAGKICPNHFVSESKLELSERNLYSARMFSQNVPLADPYNTWALFQTKNPWIASLGFDWAVPAKPKNNSKAVSPLSWWQRWFESLVKYLQIQKIKRQQKNVVCEGIVLNDTELRFHPVLKSKHMVD